MTKYAPGPSSFTRQLLGELAERGYGTVSWQKFFVDAWHRSLDDIKGNPELTRSFLTSSAAVFLIGFVVLGLSWNFQSPRIAVSAGLYWFPWYGLVVAFVITHLGMADRREGHRDSKFSAPNQLTFIRFSLAPLAMTPALAVPMHAGIASVFATLIVCLSFTDVLDGWLARKLQATTRLGRMQDYFADVALLLFLAVGLYRADVIPASLFWLLAIRYPGSILGALIVYFTKGPITLRPTVFGRVTTFVTSIALLLLAIRALIGSAWLPEGVVLTIILVLQILVAISIVYLIYRVMRESPSI